MPESKYAFVSINGNNENAATVFAYHVYFGLPFPALLDPAPGQEPVTFPEHGAPGPVSRAYRIGFYPTFYVIDPKGRITWRSDGEQPRRAAPAGARAAPPASSARLALRRRAAVSRGCRGAGATSRQPRLYRISHGRGSRHGSRRRERSSVPPTRRCAARTCAGSARLFRPYRLKLTFVCALIVFSACLGVVSPFLLREILDNAIPEQEHAAAEPARRRDDRDRDRHRRDRRRPDATSRTRSARA